MCPRVCIIKLFTAVIKSLTYEISVFVIVRHFLLALTNTLAYFSTELIKAVISFMMQASGTRKASELKKTECKAFFRLLGKVVKYKNAMPNSNVFIYLMQYCLLYT